MIRAIIAVLLASPLLCQNPGPSMGGVVAATSPPTPPSFVGCWGANETFGPASSFTVSVSPTGGAGHLLVGFSRFATGTATITFSDTHNTWTPAAAQFTGDAAAGMRMYYAPAPAAGTYNVTVAFGANVNYYSASVCEYAGLSSAPTLDTAVNAPSCGYALFCTSPSFSTSSTNELVVAMGTVNSSGLTFQAGPIGGVTASLRASQDNDVGVEDATFAAAQTSITARLNISGASAYGWGMTTAAFK